jgi:hypothetical protein
MQRVPTFAPLQPRASTTPMVGGMVGDRIGKVAGGDAQCQRAGAPQFTDQPGRNEDQPEDQGCTQDRRSADQRRGPIMVRFMPTPKRLQPVQHEAVQHVLDRAPAASSGAFWRAFRLRTSASAFCFMGTASMGESAAKGHTAPALQGVQPRNGAPYGLCANAQTHGRSGQAYPCHLLAQFGAEVRVCDGDEFARALPGRLAAQLRHAMLGDDVVDIVLARADVRAR